MVDCNLEVPEQLHQYFEVFPPKFKNCVVENGSIGWHMKEFAECKKLLSKPPKMLKSGLKLEWGPIISKLFLLYLERGKVLLNVFRLLLLQYTPRKCFQTFVQSVVDARRKGDQSTVVEEIMTSIRNSSYHYQILARSRHTKNMWMVLHFEQDSYRT